MQIESGYYTAVFDTNDPSELLDHLVEVGRLKLKKQTVYQHASKTWALYHAPEPFDLDLIDSMVWIAVVTKASEQATAESTVPADELEDSGEGLISDTLQSGLDLVEGAKAELARQAKATILTFALLGGIVFLVARKG